MRLVGKASSMKTGREDHLNKFLSTEIKADPNQDEAGLPTLVYDSFASKLDSYVGRVTTKNRTRKFAASGSAAKRWAVRRGQAVERRRKESRLASEEGLVEEHPADYDALLSRLDSFVGKAHARRKSMKAVVVVAKEEPERQREERIVSAESFAGTAGNSKHGVAAECA